MNNSIKFTTAALFAFAGVAAAQTPASKPLSTSLGVVVFPAKGQTPEKQSQDEGECFAWSKSQTGFDPMNPAASAPPPPAAQAPPPPPPGGQRVRGAARGAAAGAVIGEVADDDASEGAAIGATVGAMRGGQQKRQQAGAGTRSRRLSNSSRRRNSSRQPSTSSRSSSRTASAPVSSRRDTR